MGKIYPKLTMGVIILVIKRGHDQLQVENRRGLTLLNYGLKILTKLLQKRLSLALQDFTSEHSEQ